MKYCAVIGNPIAHSQSPKIHQSFAKSLSLSLQYDKILATSDTFAEEVNDFFEQGGSGLNVTLPFKQQAYELADKVTERAELAQSVNTLWMEQGRLIGDTTDGEGLINDLKRIDFPFRNCQVLVLGAGGACRSILPPLLENQCSIALINRTKANADKLITRLKTLGELHYFSESFQPNLIINTLSESGANYLQQFFPQGLKGCDVYDISYGERAQAFLQQAKKMQAKDTRDGWGMLVEQAALSFKQWHGQLPDTEPLEAEHPQEI
ncbi:shikimate dehydrogenase [Pleionea litopenaei]|uniref:Shikimate dehydrogenase (NADP(+)) n=1 Tax=Pleionea litopenaei TaxID=3070815 RepID=A0AA51X5R2_9GAMM|nr:shikimate dehydrogenase [Pleionea sp. HL-JVS1]WMS85961.1 shikimate dehydrogenase [Pleionea sp. HL-JVS1]